MPTKNFDIPADQWTDIGPGPVSLQITGDEAITIVVDDTAPDSIDFVGHLLGTFSAREKVANIDEFGSHHIFVRALYKTSKIAVFRTSV